ncbi:MAG: hypothetical protein M3Y56_04155 [Armatimonadota bacterium]|nr:hypothetical protein [Armatimonadota bacterium]
MVLAFPEASSLVLAENQRTLSEAERATWMHTPKGWALMHSVVLISSQTVDGMRHH